MPERVPRASRAEIVLLVALLAWAVFPIVLLVVHAGQIHARFTGADGLIGADGVLGADQLQYLAWARDAGAHGLASDLFTLAPSGHVYLEPLFTITGALRRLGLSLQLAYLLWKPIAAVALFAGRGGVGAPGVRRPPGGARRRGGARPVHVPAAGRVVQLDQLRPRPVPLSAVPARLRAARRQQAVGLRPERARARVGPGGPAGGRARGRSRSRRPQSGPRARRTRRAPRSAGRRRAGLRAGVVAASVARSDPDPDLRGARGLAALRPARPERAGDRSGSAARLLLPAVSHRPRLDARLALRGDLAVAAPGAARGPGPGGGGCRARTAAARRSGVRAGAAAVDRWRRS